LKALQVRSALEYTRHVMCMPPTVRWRSTCVFFIVSRHFKQTVSFKNPF